jgi:hypothetical protein
VSARPRVGSRTVLRASCTACQVNIATELGRVCQGSICCRSRAVDKRREAWFLRARTLLVGLATMADEQELITDRAGT